MLFIAKYVLKEFIDPEYLQPEKFKKEFLNNKPFPYLELKCFLKENRAIELLKALSQEKFFNKEADLFKFSQTNDLGKTQNKVIKEFVQFLYSKEFIDFMQKLTGFKFKNKADIAGTLYQNTDYLLCHDDELEGRKIAYLFYLTNMEEKKGGSLNLLESGVDGNPSGILKKIVPKFCTLAFFEVSPISFHEVEEVIVDEQRIAIGGWFYSL
ncbi:2OG-Fe(II) oxygenase [Candidatus Woesearchaeota archaeon]|nr:2OG-Fe(II) oxygenase [Candidatus Woesearchaeota archaeon]